MKKLYAIRDVLAQAIGPVVTMAADAPAVRMFADVASDPQSQVCKHVNDFELVCLGDISDMGEIDASGVRVVVTGAAWKASQAPAEVAD